MDILNEDMMRYVIYLTIIAETESPTRLIHGTINIKNMKMFFIHNI